MALTKSVALIQNWTAVAQAAVNESTAYINTANYDCMLSIQAFLDTTTAHVGTQFSIQTSSSTGQDPSDAGDECWEELTTYIDLVGTATLITTGGIEYQGTTVFGAATVAAGFAVADVVSRWVGIKDATVVANSELMLQTGYTNNVSITVLNGCQHYHAAGATISNIASTKLIQIPISTNRVRVVVNNNYDANGSTMLYKVMASVVTGL